MDPSFQRWLQSIDYDKVDWDESWDTDNDRSAQEAWFEEEEESVETPPDMGAELARLAASLPDLPRRRSRFNGSGNAADDGT